jgi:DNA-directed RNA polymerase specialized sigma24 family protein
MDNLWREAIEKGAAWKEALDSLSREERLVCIWRRVGFSNEQIADHLGWPAADVDAVFRRAHDKVQQILDGKSEDRWS